MDKLKKLKEDKKELEMKIGKLINDFEKEYDIVNSIEDYVTVKRAPNKDYPGVIRVEVVVRI